MVTRQVKRIAVAMSGGVDSAMSCFILKRKGYEVHGVYMQNWSSYDEAGQCSGEKDYNDALRAAEIIGVPLTRVNFEKEYWNYVFTEFLSKYEKGLTPNPDILCNKHIKFGFLFNYCMNELGVDWFATGHYARLQYSRDGIKLLKAADSAKDQTYFLSHVKQEALQKTLFPIGEVDKSTVKQLALKYGLESIAARRESYGICFIGKRNFPEFLNQYIDTPNGPMVDIDTGKVLAEHGGIHLWTLCQRICLQGQANAYYVCHINAKDNIIYVAGGRNHPALGCKEFHCKNPHWISEDHSNRLKASGALRCQVRARYRFSLTDCMIHYSDGELLVELDNVVSGHVAPGQYAVFYDGDECLGGAMISQIKSDYVNELTGVTGLEREVNLPVL